MSVLLRAGGDRSFLSWSDLQRFGGDAVTVPSAGVLRLASGEAEERAASKGFQDAGSVAGDRLLGLRSYAVVVREVPPGEAAPGGS
jgi:hypothetical protein